MASEKRLLYFYHHPGSFVLKDIEIFKSCFTVLPQDFIIRGAWHIPFLWIRQMVFLLIHCWKGSIIVIQFAGYHSLIPAIAGKIFNLPVLIIPGGIDAMKYPDIDYGNFTKPVLTKFTCLSYRLASHIAPVHETLIYWKDEYRPSGYEDQGIAQYCPGMKTPVTVIYNGYDPEIFKPAAVVRQPETLVTIATNLDDPVRMKVKGIDLILEVAGDFPQLKFIFIGVSQGLNNLPENVELLPPVDNSALPRLLSEYEFYLQLSVSEGFPNALSEAMLCGCIPIGSNVTSIPHIIGEAGFILEKRDPELFRRLIRRAIECDRNRYSSLARERIKENFHLELRKKKLLDLIQRMLSG